MGSNLKYILSLFIVLVFNINYYSQQDDSLNNVNVFDRTLDTNHYQVDLLDSTLNQENEYEANLLAQNEDSLKPNERKMKSGPLFEFGIGKSDEVSVNWGNYYYEKESYKKAINKFSLVKGKDLDVLRKMANSFFRK